MLGEKWRSGTPFLRKEPTSSTEQLQAGHQSSPVQNITYGNPRHGGGDHASRQKSMNARWTNERVAFHASPQNTPQEEAIVGPVGFPEILATFGQSYYADSSMTSMYVYTARGRNILAALSVYL